MVGAAHNTLGVAGVVRSIQEVEGEARRLRSRMALVEVLGANRPNVHADRQPKAEGLPLLS